MILYFDDIVEDERYIISKTVSPDYKPMIKVVNELMHGDFVAGNIWQILINLICTRFPPS